MLRWRPGWKRAAPLTACGFTAQKQRRCLSWLLLLGWLLVSPGCGLGLAPIGSVLRSWLRPPLWSAWCFLAPRGPLLLPAPPCASWLGRPGRCGPSLVFRGGLGRLVPLCAPFPAGRVGGWSGPRGFSSVGLGPLVLPRLAFSRPCSFVSGVSFPCPLGPRPCLSGSLRPSGRRGPFGNHAATRRPPWALVASLTPPLRGSYHYNARVKG